MSNRRLVLRRNLLQNAALLQVSRRQTSLSTMMLSALKGRGLNELQRELAALDPNPSANGSAPDSASDNDSAQSLEEDEIAGGSK